jgi:hypothetical protein
MVTVAVQHLGEARTALDRLDVCIPNLKTALPALMAQYEQARIVVDTGKGGPHDAP